MTTPFPCPECGAPLDLEPACVVERRSPIMKPFQPIDEPLEIRTITRTVPVALCTGCEFCLEIQ